MFYYIYSHCPVPALVSVVRHFKMSIYMLLSLRIRGSWLAMSIILLSAAICLSSVTYCSLTEHWRKCYLNIFLRTSQIMIAFIFSCCWLIISDLATTALKEKFSRLSGSVVPGVVQSDTVVPIPVNNFFPDQDDQNCCSARDHVR